MPAEDSECFEAPDLSPDAVVEYAEANNAGGQRRPGVHDNPDPVISHSETTQPLEPTDRPLDGLIANDKFCLTRLLRMASKPRPPC